ncbi:MAG: CcdB family protein [Campylobacterota bacterium]|nr:CcdB family protein [Campylobacterota bacterium]
MAQFDVYKNLNDTTNQQIPYLLDIQNDILRNLNTRVVVPLIKDIDIIKNLNPKFKIEGEYYIMSTSELATIPVGILEDKVTSLKEKRADIINAIDFMITGF